MGLKAHLSRPLRYAFRSALSTTRSALSVSLHRLIAGPRLPAWNWAAEFSTGTFRAHLATAFRMRNIVQARQYLDAVTLVDSTVLSRVQISPVKHGCFRGQWFTTSCPSSTTLLYSHGGGYSFYPKTYTSLIASITLAANCRTFALDYGLAPEHRFPSQLQEATAAYEWLLKTGVAAENMVVAGDSAGGNLTLALLLSLRDSNSRLPALAVLLSPATDFVAPTELPRDCSFIVNAPYDWIQREMLASWADWFCSSSERNDPLVSPIYASLRGLPPMYIQAGKAEILYDGIRGFAERLKKEEQSVQLDAWDCMNHDFQLFGNFVPQSVEAVRRIGEVIQQNRQGRNQAADRDREVRRRT